MSELVVYVVGSLLAFEVGRRTGRASAYLDGMRDGLNMSARVIRRHRDVVGPNADGVADGMEEASRELLRKRA